MHKSDFSTTPPGNLFEYSSGLGEVILQKIQAEPGDAFEHDGNGKLVTDGNGDPVISHTDTRWRGTGRTIINNKGLQIKQYEPYFSDISGYEDEDDVRLYGVSPLLHYDPLQHPKQNQKNLSQHWDRMLMCSYPTICIFSGIYV